MTGEMFSTLLINSVIIGMSYALFASGLTLAFGVMNIVLFCHGAIYMLGAFCFYFIFRQLAMNYIVSLVFTTIGTGCLGLLLERSLFRKLNYAILPSLFAAVGVTMIIEQCAMLGFGTLPRSVHSPFTGVLRILGGVVSMERLATMGIATILIAVLQIILNYTKIGRALRAVSQDAQAASAFGINPSRMFAGACFIGCALAGAAGGLMAPIYGVGYSIGGPWLMKGFMIIILGGLGSVVGSVAGGLILGVIESFGVFYFGYLSSTFIFGAVILILIWRPMGLLGHAD
jgi:branched-chain amino acid transport system permease protein